MRLSAANTCRRLGSAVLFKKLPRLQKFRSSDKKESHANIFVWLFSFIFRVSDLLSMAMADLYVSRKLNIQALLILVLQFF